MTRRDEIFSALNEQADPPRDRPELWVLRLKANQMRTFTLFSERWWGVWTHWSGKKTEPCMRPADTCHGCLHGKKKEWKAYLHAYCIDLKQEVVLELPKRAAETLRDQLGAECSFRGNRIQVKRGAGSSSGIQISVLTANGDLSKLPPAKDVRPSVWALWGSALPEAQVLAGEQVPEPSANGFR